MQLHFKNPELKTTEPCIFKMYVGNKYYIWKTLNIGPMVANLVQQIDREVKQFKETSAISKVVQEIIDTKVGVLDIEIVKSYSNDTRLQLLIDERNLLLSAKKDKNCLNLTFSNHDIYPKWMDQQTINEFKEYYTTGKNKGSSVKDKNLRTFLKRIAAKNYKSQDDFVEEVFNYIKSRYK